MTEQAETTLAPIGHMQRDLLAELHGLALWKEDSAATRIHEIVSQLIAIEEQVRGNVLEQCDRLLQVSAAIRLMLTLLDQDDAACAEPSGLHCMLSLLKSRLDSAVDGVQGMY
ncbi:DUF1484 family protein [Cupriavidus sp. 2TAF22]|uniref:DUF1484 family protein n=1 Tax=unclassified Cupriavidus TaxID=2640874 RepID=UPI003F8D929A